MEHWIDQLPHYLRQMWKVVKENAQKAQKGYAKQYDKNKKGHKLQVGERVLWFRPQDLSGDDRKFALPYVGPYIVTELKGLNNVYIRLENSTQEPFIVNVDQLSRCYAGLSVEGPLQFSHAVQPRRANRRRRAKVRIDLQQPEPTHQMTLRQTDNLNFDGNITSISTELLQVSDCIEEAHFDTLLARAESFTDRVSINSLVLFSDRFELCEMSQRKSSKDRSADVGEKKRREDEDKRRKEEDRQRKKEDDRRREEDERRRKEDEARKEKSRTAQFFKEFGDDLEGGTRRKAVRPRQSSSPPRQHKREGQTVGGRPRAQSHQQSQPLQPRGRMRDTIYFIRDKLKQVRNRIDRVTDPYRNYNHHFLDL
ncbi:MAG: hypothetical protein GY822_27600, partial [Deltaproteobacteria bacterium]|nr:hypothetical protein [Deltaproteobacteria bacterium]